MSFFRTATLLTAILVAALYGVQFALNSNVTKYAEPITELLDPQSDEGYATWEGRVQRLHRIVFLLHDAETDLVDVGTVLDKALSSYDYSSEYAPMLRKSLIENVRIGQLNGLFTEGNRERISRGLPPTITEGAFTGESMDAQSVIPTHLAPEIGMNFANLLYTPHTTAFSNQTATPQKAERAKEFYTASIISRDTLQYIIRSIGSTENISDL